MLSLRGTTFGDDLKVVLEGVGRSQLVELNVEETSCACDLALSEAVVLCESLRALVVSNNPRLLGANATCAAVAESRVERFEARKIGAGMTLPSLRALASAPRLLFLDLRGTELLPDRVSAFLTQMRKSTHLYSLKLSSASQSEFFTMLRGNTSLGIVSVGQFDFIDDEAAELLGDNSSLFVFDPLPASCIRLAARIKENYVIAKKVRGLILLILMAHKFHRYETDFAVFPKDVIVLIMKQLWSMRRDRAWSVLRQQ